MWLVQVDSWLIASILVAFMFVCAELGVRIGLRTADRPGATSTRIDDATAALFGLLLAFTFAEAEAKQDRRLWLMVHEATAIGDLAGAAAVLEEPERGELQHLLRDYIDVRIATARANEENEASLLATTRRLQGALTDVTARAVQKKNSPSVHTPLVMTLNATTTAFENRRAALNDHVPVTILVLLFTSALIGSLSLGRVQGVHRARQPVPTAIFTALVGLAFYTTLDLEKPRSGIVRVPVGALESVRKSLSP